MKVRDNPQARLRHVVGQFFEVHESEILFTADVQEVLDRAGAIQLRIQARLTGFDKIQNTVTWHQPRTWRDYVKKGLKMKWPRLFRRLKFKMEPVYEQYDFYGKVCPHLGRDADRHCLDWIMSVEDPTPAVRPDNRRV